MKINYRCNTVEESMKFINYLLQKTNRMSFEILPTETGYNVISNLAEDGIGDVFADKTLTNEEIRINNTLEESGLIQWISTLIDNTDIFRLEPVLTVSIDKITAVLGSIVCNDDNCVDVLNYINFLMRQGADSHIFSRIYCTFTSIRTKEYWKTL